METAWSSGHLHSSVANFTFKTGASTCRCCALCHQLRTCASLSYNDNTGECLLHNSVAGYDTLIPDSHWKYLVVPGRSQHHQFCRQDSDCRVVGDFCRGRVCTALQAVTCRVIFERFGAGERYGDFIPRVYGWLHNTDVALACMMGPGFHGYTRLLRNQNKFRELKKTNLMKYNTAIDPQVTPHSILSYADYIREAGNGTTYSIKVFRCDQRFMIHFKMPSSEPVLSHQARPNIGSGTVSNDTTCVKFTVSPPYLTGSEPTMLTVNADNTKDVEGSIVREDGQISWEPCEILVLLIYIRE